MLENLPAEIMDFLDAPSVAIKHTRAEISQSTELDQFQKWRLLETLEQQERRELQDDIFADIFDLYKDEHPLFHPQIMRDYVNCPNFDPYLLNNLLVRRHDELFNIKTRVLERSRIFEFPIYVRDARGAIVLKRQISQNDKKVTTINMLQRCLARYRGICYALANTPNIDNHSLEKELHTALDITFLCAGALCSDPLELEKTFDSEAIRILHAAGLTTGLTEVKEHTKLLSFYRYLASTLDPAHGMVTLRTERGKKSYSFFDTEIPLTAKTNEQLKELDNYIVPGAHAYQQAYEIYKDLIMEQWNMLPAQTRWTIAPTLKYAYLSDSRIVDVSAGKFHTVASTTTTRSASLVYTGKGLSDESIQKHTQDNLDQILHASEYIFKSSVEYHNHHQKDPSKQVEYHPKTIHITLLNTNSMHTNQSVIVKNVKAAVDAKHHGVSYIPINFEGMFHPNDVAPLVQDHVDLKASVGKSKQCAKNAATIARTASKLPNVLNHTCCSSGQNRTGTVEEKRTQLFIKEKIRGRTSGIVQLLRGKALHNNRVATLHLPGSSGLKTVSQSGDLFKSHLNESLYTKVADTKIKSPADNRYVKKIISEPSSVAIDDLAMLHHHIRKRLSHQHPLTPAAIHVSLTLEQHLNRHPQDRTLIDQSRAILHNIKRVIEHPKQADAALQQLLKTANKMSTRPTSAKIATAVLGFVAAALLIIGILAAIPSGGASLLLTTVSPLVVSAAFTGASITSAMSGGIFFKSKDSRVYEQCQGFQQAVLSAANSPR